MSDSNSLRIVPQASAAPLTPDHKRFYTLIGQIEKARTHLADWREQNLLFRQGHEQQRVAIKGEFVSVLTEWVFALDRVLPQRCWTRRERDTLRQVLCQDASTLLQIELSDAVKALFEKHSVVDFDTGRRAELEKLKTMTETFTGVDLGDTSGIDSEADLMEHIEEKMAAHAEAEQQRTARRKQRRRKSTAQEQREQEAQRVTQSVRDIYRKLVSVLHPDREPDARARAAKNELMQKVNQAYEANDLLTLLEVQLQIEQINQSQLQNVSVEHIRRYNKVLAEQLTSLKSEVSDLRFALELEYDLVLVGNDPRQLGQLLQRTKQSMRRGLAEQRRDLRMLSDVAATKRWLRRKLLELQDADPYDIFF